MPTYDLVVLGSGGAGFGVATRCRDAGWSVAIADTRPFGGTCALRGCEPKKTLWTVVEAYDRARRLAPHGLSAPPAAIDWPALMRFKRSFTAPVPDRRAAELEERGIDAFQGATRFIGRNRLSLAGTEVEARHVVIATGARPMDLSIEGAGHLRTSDDFLDLETLPGRLLFVGGGYISFEFAHIAKRAGAAVTILHQDDKPLGHFDPDLVRRLVDKSRRLGIDVRLSQPAEVIAPRDGGFRVTAKGEAFDADLVFHGAGRVPALDGLDLEAAGVATEKGRLVLDPHLRSTSNRAVFAAGDAAAKGPPLTPVSGHDAEIVAHNLLKGSEREPDYSGVPSVAFTIPPIAAVGMTEAEARKAGIRLRVSQGDMADFSSIRRLGEDTAAYKVLVCEETRCVVGAHLLGPDAEEAINLFALAVRNRQPVEDLRRLLTAYPSAASNISAMLKD